MIKLKLQSHKPLYQHQSLIKVWGLRRISKSTGNINIILYYTNIWEDSGRNFEEFAEWIDRIYLVEACCAASKINNLQIYKKIKCRGYGTHQNYADNTQYTCIFEYMAHLAQKPELVKQKNVIHRSYLSYL
jgi:hypothetical protein